MTDRVSVKPLWTPSRNFVEQSNLKKFQNWLFVKKGLYFKNYHDLWDWSVTDLEDFWESIWQFNDVKSHSLYFDVLIRSSKDFIGTEWFRGATINYAEHIFRHKNTSRPAIMYQSEREALREVSWRELEKQVGAVAAFLRQSGVGVGDRVAGVLPNGPQAVIAFLATNSLGAVWSSCSPDFGTASVLDRFQQIEPKVLFLTDGYTYNGKAYDKLPLIGDLIAQLPTVKKTVLLPFLNPQAKSVQTVLWGDVLKTPFSTLEFTPVPFGHPLWILYSSGTTGKPKAITHSVGGCLLEHFKALSIHQNVKPGDRYFWYSTTGWMMWNFSVASMLVGATLVLYEGAAAFPNLNVLWDLAEKAKINHFGGGAAYYIACMKAGINLQGYKFNQLQTIGSTGSPLPAEGFEWVYKTFKKDVWLISLSGGTDICSGFVGGCPTLPLYAGEIQCRLLGCKLEAYDEKGQSIRNELGEMVITQPMPSMPIYFWNDPQNQRYRASYFEDYPGVWRHGDWIQITEREGVVIYGRSDATLNRDGVRIGTSEIYSAVESVEDIADSLVVCLEQEGGKYFMPLFVVPAKGQKLTDDLKSKINHELRTRFSPRHVPDAIYAISEIPYTISGKKMEAPVKKILMGINPAKVASRDTMRNPQSLDFFVKFAPEKLSV